MPDSLLYELVGALTEEWLVVGAREHHAPYLGMVSIAAHAWCEWREAHT